MEKQVLVLRLEIHNNSNDRDFNFNFLETAAPHLFSLPTLHIPNAPLPYEQRCVIREFIIDVGTSLQ